MSSHIEHNAAAHARHEDLGAAAAAFTDHEGDALASEIKAIYMAGNIDAVLPVCYGDRESSNTLDECLGDYNLSAEGRPHWAAFIAGLITRQQYLAKAAESHSVNYVDDIIAHRIDSGYYEVEA